MPDTIPPNVSIVIPCYRSSEWLAYLVAEIVEVMETEGESFELLLINDASPDGTWEVICQLSESFSCVRGIDLMFNTGQYRATFCGLELARGQVVVTMDDDFQHPPSALPVVISSLRGDSECDCVIGAYLSKRHGPLRNLGTAVMGKLFQWLYDKPAQLSITSYRAMRSTLVQAIRRNGTINPNINPLIFQSTRRIKNVHVEHQERASGKSGYGFFQLTRLMIDNVFSVSTLPLKIVSFGGIMAAFGSALMGAVYLLMSLAGRFNAPGFATQVLLTIFFGGLILFSIGLVGEYMIRIMEEVRGKPRFVIRGQAVGSGEPTAVGESQDGIEPSGHEAAVDHSPREDA